MFLGILGTATQEATAQTLALAPNRTSRVGDTIILAVGSGATSTNDNVFSATDNKGNTWTEITHQYRSGVSQISLLRSTLTSALGPADTITIAHGGVGMTLWVAAALIFDDLSATDVAVSGQGGTGNALTLTTAVATQNTQLVLSAFIYSSAGQTMTPGAGSEWSKQISVGSTSVRNLGLYLDYVNAAGARTGSISITSTSAWVGAVVAVNSVLQPQVVRPTSTITAGAAVTPDTMTSHAAVSDGDATSYDDSVPTPTNAVKEWAIGAMTVPADLSSVKIIVEESRVNATSGSFKIILKEGTTVRSTSSAFTLTDKPVFYTYTVPSADAATVTDWTNLRVRVEETAS